MYYEKFYRVASLCFRKTLFLLFSENKLPDDLSWILSSSLDCIVLTLDVNLLTPAFVFYIPTFHKIFCFQVVMLSSKTVTKLE